MSLPYYLRYPDAFLGATEGWPGDLKGVYGLLLDLIYRRDGKLEDHPQTVAGHLGYSVRAWNQFKAELIRRGKIRIVDGIIRNSRSDKELITLRSYQEKQAKNRERPNKNKPVESPPRTYAGDLIPSEDTSEPNGSSVDKQTRSPKAKKARAPKVEPIWIGDEWELTEANIAFALDPENTKGIQLERQEAIREGRVFKRWFQDKRDAGDPVGRRPGFDRSWQTWVCRAAAGIARDRPRTPATSSFRSFKRDEELAISEAAANAALEECERRGTLGPGVSNARPKQPLQLVSDQGADRGSADRTGAGRPEGGRRQVASSPGPLWAASASDGGSGEGVLGRLDQRHDAGVDQGLQRRGDGLAPVAGEIQTDAWASFEPDPGDRGAPTRPAFALHGT